MLLDFARQQKPATMLAYAFLFMAYPIEQIVFPQFFGRIIEALSNGTTTLGNLLSRIRVLLITVVALLVLKQVMFVALDSLDVRLLPRIEGFFRERLVHGVLDNFEDDYRELEVGELIAKVVKLPQVLRDVFHQMRNYIVPGLLVSVLVVVFYAVAISPRIAAVSGVAMLLVYVAVWLLACRCIAQSRERDRMNNRLHEEIDDTLGNLLAVYAADEVTGEKRRLDVHQQTHDARYLESGDCAVRFKAYFSMLYCVLFIVMNGYAIHQTYSGALSIGALVTVLMINSYVTENLEVFSGEIRVLMYNFGVLAESQVFLTELFRHAERRRRARGGAAAQKPTAAPVFAQHARGEIHFHDVTFHYDDDGGGGEQKSRSNKAPVLDRISLHVPAGQTVALVGDIGSGKSSLIKLLLRLRDCNAGRVELDGRDVARCSTGDVRRRVGYVPQQPRLFNRSVYENVVFGNDRRRWPPGAVRGVIERTGVAPLFVGLPLNKPVGKHGSRVSGGQRQAIALLRMALGNRKVLLLDEPTSALDPTNKKYVMKMLAHISRGKTCVIVTHDSELMRSADRVIRLQRGRVVSDTRNAEEPSRRGAGRGGRGGRGSLDGAQHQPD